MSINNSISETLNLKDLNVNFYQDFLEMKNIKGVLAKVYHALLSSPSPCTCPKCDHSNPRIIKWGVKSSRIVLNKVAGYDTYIQLDKQRFKCHECNKTFTIESDIVNKNCFISKDVYLSIMIDATHKKSEVDIAHSHTRF